MDYGKLNKNELIKECEDEGLSFSSSWTKEKLEDILIENANQRRSGKTTNNNTVNKSTTTNNKKTGKVETAGSNGVGIAGAIINIIFTSVWLIMTLNIYFYSIQFGIKIMSEVEGQFFLGLIIVLVILAILTLLILNIVFSITYLLGKTSKVKSGVMGIFFGGLIGGILILCGKDYNIKNKDKKTQGGNHA